MSRINKSKTTKSRSVIARGWERGEQEVTADEYRFSLGDGANVLRLIVVKAVAQYAEDHWTVYVHWANRMVCELHLNKAVTLPPNKNMYLSADDRRPLLDPFSRVFHTSLLNKKKPFVLL